jgi:alanyl-tRNA synthetase
MAAVPTTADEIRSAYLEFFKARRHKVVPSSSLVPENDPTLLLSNAGMNQFKPYFLGTVPFPHEVPYATSCQKCFRTGDLERVGYTARHHTFFEMLGNFSFGGYFKEDAIRWAWEFVSGVLKIEKDRLWVSVYRDDDEAIAIWQKVALLPPERIVRLGEEDNFWTMGPTGPCGPCSEIYVDLAPEDGPVKDFSEAAEKGRLLEIWNLVFTQFDRQADGSLKPLPKPNIDTGMGLERVASVMQKVPSNYETDLIQPLMDAIARAAGKTGLDPASRDYTSLKVISDHLRATTFLIADGVLPSNEGRGYVLRRILRRALRHGHLLGIEKAFLYTLVPEVVKKMSGIYPNLVDRQSHVVNVVSAEEERFLATLDKGTDRLTERLEEMKKNHVKVLAGADAFMLYDTYGFPLDLTQEILKEQGLSVDQAGFEAAMESQRDRARSAWSGSGEKALPNLYQELNARLAPTVFTGYESMAEKSKFLKIIRVVDGHHEEVPSIGEGDYAFLILDRTPFYAEKGGQVGDKGTISTETGVADVLDTQVLSEKLIGHWCLVTQGTLASTQDAEAKVRESERRAIMRNHTATHLLHAAMRQVLGTHVHQAGSYVGPDRLRFDFTHFEAVRPDQLLEMETIANRKVLENIALHKEEMSFHDAKKKGALAFFSEKYGERVRVVDVPGFSMELCGGIHVTRTGDIGLIKIVAENSVAAGVRRLEAVTGEGALARFRDAETVLQGLAQTLKIPEKSLGARLDGLLDELKDKDREISVLKTKLAGNMSGDLLSKKQDVKGVALVVSRADDLDSEGLRQLTDQLKDKLGSGVVVLGSAKDGKVAFIVGVTKDLTGRIKAGDLIKKVAQVAGGGGGGRPDMAQAGGKDASKMDEALEKTPGFVEGLIK